MSIAAVSQKNAIRPKAMIARLGVMAFAVGAFALVSNSPAEEPAKRREEPSVWMTKKLDYSQAILKGLATGDFELIAKNGREMKSLSKIEGFVRRRSTAYQTQLEIFQHANDDIIRQANDENVEGVALAFHQLTISCVNCHKQLRNAVK